MKKVIYFVLALVAICFIGCINDDDNGIFNCTKGSGSVVEQTLEFTDFKGIELKCAADINITQGEEFSIVVISQQNILDELETRLDGDVLEIDLDGCVRDFDLNFEITMPEITFLKISGSGKIRGTNEFIGEILNLRITGSGEMDLGLDFQKINSKITGSGDISLEGICEEFDYRITGSGNVHGFDLISNIGKIKISGSGDAEVFVNEFLSVEITGSGNVLFKGTPEEIEEDISGSGDVKDVN